jgi:hypothetical protein
MFLSLVNKIGQQRAATHCRKPGNESGNEGKN